MSVSYGLVRATEHERRTERRINESVCEGDGALAIREDRDHLGVGNNQAEHEAGPECITL